MTGKIVVVGSYSADLTVHVPHLPHIGETVKTDNINTSHGGKGSNQAVAAARLGAQVTFIGRVGEDAYADEAFALWQQEGVDAQFVVRDPRHRTSLAIVTVDPDGENTIVSVGGANLHIEQSDIDAAEDVIAAADVLLTQLSIAEPIARHALEVAGTHGVKTILNPTSVKSIATETLAAADYLTPNEVELRRLANSATSMRARPNQITICTLGEAGAQWFRRRAGGQIETDRVAAFKMDVVSTVGAGDAFNAGLAVALSEGRDLISAIRFANATAALAVTKIGATASMPQRADVDALVKS